MVDIHECTPELVEEIVRIQIAVFLELKGGGRKAGGKGGEEGGRDGWREEGMEK